MKLYVINIVDSSMPTAKRNIVESTKLILSQFRLSRDHNPSVNPSSQHSRRITAGIVSFPKLAFFFSFGNE